MSATGSAAEILRADIEPLSWADRFARLAAAARHASPAERDAIGRLRSDLAEAALAELSGGWDGIPLKAGILRLEGSKLRAALGHAAKAARDRRIAEIVGGGGLPLDRPLAPGGFATGLDERVIEIPLALAAARLETRGEVLDAGAALNLPLVRQLAGRPVARVTHFTMTGANEPVLPGNADCFVYAYGDLRAMPYAEGAFDRIVCVSTLEHVGMDNARYGAATEHAPESAAAAVAELVRVLAPGGELLITVPYGRAADHGWFRVLDEAALTALLAPAAPHQRRLRFFYYDRGWCEGTAVPPACVLDADYPDDVVGGVAVARIIKNGAAR